MPTPTSLPLVRAVVRRLAAAIERRIDDALRDVHGRLDGVEARQHDLEAQLHDIRAEHARLVEMSEFAANETDRIAPQIASLEGRLADVVAALPEPTRAAADESVEHGRLRARMAAISHYEERLRRLEAAIEGGTGIR